MGHDPMDTGPGILMSDPYSHSQPYSTGRGFVHLTENEAEELRKERTIWRGGMGIRYNEWSQLPNATGEVMRGVSANYDWRNYKPKPISGFSEVPKNGRKFGPPQEMWQAAKKGYRGTAQGASEPEDTSMSDTPTWGSSRESTSSGLSAQQTSLFADTTPTEGYQGYEPPKGGMGARA